MRPELGGTPVPPSRSPFSQESGGGSRLRPALAVWSKYGDKQHFLADGAVVEQDAWVGPVVKEGRTLCGRSAEGWQQFEYLEMFDDCQVCRAHFHPKLSGGDSR